MGASRSQGPVSSEADLVQTLAGKDASAECQMAHKTRRLVHGAVINIQQRKKHSMQCRALVLSAIVVSFIVLAPAIWNAVDHILGQEHLGDLSTQMALLLLFALPATLAALLLMGRILRRGDPGTRRL